MIVKFDAPVRKYGSVYKLTIPVSFGRNMEVGKKYTIEMRPAMPEPTVDQIQNAAASQ